MRLLLLFLLHSSGVVLAGPESDLSDVDVQAIAKVTREFFHSPPLSISSADTSCKYTAEPDCTREVSVAVTWFQPLVVSEIKGVWTVGRWQRELVALNYCLEALRVRQAKEDAQGLPIDLEKRRKDHAACFGPDGHAGGTRGQ